MSKRYGITMLWGMLGFVLSGGCAVPPVNTSFDVTRSKANAAIRDMRDDPKPLERPVVVLAGFCDPGLASSLLKNEFNKLTNDRRVIDVSFFSCGNFDECRKQVIDAVDKAFPSDDPEWTTEVDVVGMSMGGLVARYAAAPVESKNGDNRRLRVARLFTISTPHRGAAMATFPTLSRLQLDMRADSKFLRDLTELEESAEPYPLFPYVRLGDFVVGAANAAPVGQSPWWVPGDPLFDSHLTAMLDARIIADVARRLRGEEPLTTEPPAPLPGMASKTSSADADLSLAHQASHPEPATP